MSERSAEASVASARKLCTFESRGGMWAMTTSTSYDEVDEVDEISDEEVDRVVETTLEQIGISLSTLRDYAERGRFDNESQRRAWFLISGLGRG